MGKKTTAIERAFSKVFNGVPIPMLDIPEIAKEARQRVEAGATPESAWLEIRKRYEQKSGGLEATL